MAEVNFRSLQNLHESLLQKQQKVSEQNQQDFTREVRQYIEQAKRGGSNISSTRERDQIRANLRYWANYIYGIEKTFPDTELAPSALVNRPISARTIIMLVIVGIAIATLAGIRSLASNGTSEIETPIQTQIFASPTAPAIVTTATVQAVETPTSVFVGSDVVFTSPENGENVLPKVVFRGAYTNLKAESSIHILLIRSDRLYPVTNFFPVPQESSTGEWEIEAAIYQNPDELEQAENLAVVPAACFDDSCREILAKATQDGITIEALPSQFSFTLYRDSSRVVYRNAYHAILEMRLVYPKVIETSPNQKSYDLYTSKPDGTDERGITNLPGIDEKSPNLSPDGRKIVYVQVVRTTNAHSIHTMDSNGQNDRVVISGGESILENPQWSPDSEYVSYALGDTSQSSSTAYWSIRTYNLLTGEDEKISGEPGPYILNRYHSWIPNTREIVLNLDTSITVDSGFIKVPIDSPEDDSLFYDTNAQDVQPSISLLGNGYLLTYTVIGPSPDFVHDIYVILDSNRQVPLDGAPVKLIPITNRSGGKDHPVLEPNSNVIYYVNAGNIYKVEFSIEQGKITLVPGTIDDGEYYGDLIIETGTITDNPSFDIKYMEAYFPI